MASKVTRLTQQHKKLQNGLAQAAGIDEMKLAYRLISGEISEAEYVSRAVSINKIAHEKAVQMAEDYVGLARLISSDIRMPPAQAKNFDLAAATARAMSTVRASNGLTVMESAHRIPLSDVEKARKRVAATMRRWTAGAVHAAHVETIIRSAEHAGSSWRVVTDGQPCAFCAMLASYGEDINGAELWPNHYFHSDCGCTIEEVPLGVEPEFSALEQQFVQLRELADREAEQHPKLYHGKTKRSRLMSAMRAHGAGIVRDASRIRE